MKVNIWIETVRKKLGEGSWADMMFVFSFFALSVFPLCNIDDETSSVQENRMLAQRPTLSIHKTDWEKWGKSYDAWISDHFWGRKTYVEIGKHTKKILTCYTPSGRAFKGCFMGTNNMLFINEGPITHLNYANVNPFSEDELSYIVSTLQDFQNLCDSIHTKFYFIIPPDKEKVYGEYYANYVKKINDDSLSNPHQLVRYIQQNSRVKSLYLDEAVRKGKSNGMLYYKQDTHWNCLGSYFGYLGLFELMSEDFSEDFSLSKSTFEPYIVQNGTDIIQDLSPRCSYVKADNTNYKQMVYTPDVNEIVQNSPDSLYRYHLTSSRPHKMILIGDSYAEALKPALSRTVGDLYVVMKMGTQEKYIDSAVKALVRREHPDVVILEMLERKLKPCLIWTR